MMGQIEIEAECLAWMVECMVTPLLGGVHLKETMNYKL